MTRMIVWLCCFVLVLGSAACGGETAVTEPPAANESGETATAVLESNAETEAVATASVATQSPPEPAAETEPTATSVPESAPAETAGQDPAKIAFLGALELDWQQEQLNWARMAVEDFNAAAGWSVELVEVDAGTGPATITSAIDPLLSDNAVYAVLGPSFASQIAAASTMFDMVALPQIIFNGAPGVVPPGSQRLFRPVPTDDQQGPAAARFIVDTLDAQQVFVIVQEGQGTPGSYGYELYTAFEQALNAAGGAVIARMPVAAEATDFNSLAADIQASGAEAVFAADTSAEQGVQIAEALRTAGVETPLVGHYGWANARFAASADGAYVLSYAPALADPALAQRYTEQHGSFGVYGPLAYEATMVALAAIQRAAESGQLSPAAVAEEIAAASMDSTVLARPLAFTTDGNLQDAQFYVLQVEDGGFRTLEP